jgi:hypothetical protein
MSKNDYRITVIADDRESKSEVILFLSEMKNVSVEGIGKHIAEKIRWAVGEQIQPYGFIDEFPI